MSATRERKRDSRSLRSQRSQKISDNNPEKVRLLAQRRE
jgi:hypothetical protein